MHDIGAVVIAKLTEKQKGFYGSKDWNHASRVGATCARELALWRTAPETALQPEPELQIIFKHGNWMEKEAIGQLTQAGYELSEQDATFEWPSFRLRGRIDTAIRIDGHKRPMEIKGYAPQSWERLNTIEDFLTSTKEYLRKVPAQLLSYMLCRSDSEGYIFLLNKLTGKPKTIALRLEGPTLEWGEALLKKLQLVNACIEKGTLPDRVEYDESVCGVCPFRASCLTDIPASARGMQVLSGEQENELAGLLVEREKLAIAKKKYEDVDEEITRIVKGIDRIVCGDWLVVGKEVVKELVDTKALPDEIKKKYMKESKFWRKSISNLKANGPSE